ncbi:aspartyl-phosphate phosphatase Spo0E family protein [Paenibacillus sp. UNC496MF]|uniref:aspartyl-phosphate phosphatase Spo0E family protein n=1 Tax=Paenibacillus sp. UNC496MF TaxID=1502753 RepID=UPI00210D04C0|nr:aspartyl-phosphate phosphatase Spo0E family protein [Paenibacillus sp. UNC496MF]
MPETRRAQIRSEIERKREEMHRLSDRFGMQSEIVIRISQELDGLLNRYGQLGKVVKT